MPKRTLEVDDFELDVALNPSNLADGGEGHGAHLLQDGFMKIVVYNPGNNPFWREEFEFTLLVARLADQDSEPEVFSNFDVCLLGPEDIVTEVSLVEDTLQGRFGIWLIVDIETPETKHDDHMLSHMLMLNEAHATV